MAALPPLRSDLIIEAVAPLEGEPAYDLSSPDLSRTHRVTSQAYLALSMIDGRKDFRGWATAVQQMYPELGAGQLWGLIQTVAGLGYFAGRALLPPALPLDGKPLIRDLDERQMPFVRGAPTVPNASLTSYEALEASAKDTMGTEVPLFTQADFSPEETIDAMFGGDQSSPAPVTAVHKPMPLPPIAAPPMSPPARPGLRPQIPVSLPPSDAPGTDELDLEVLFPEEPAPAVGGSPPYEAPAPGLWTAPPTPIPTFGGRPPPAAEGAPFPPFDLEDLPVETTGPGMPTPFDSHPTLEQPIITSLPSGEGHGEVPRAHPDLIVEPTDQPGLVAVTGPEKAIPFQIYELEHKMLSLMDGTKTLEQLLDEVRALGHPVDRGQLQSFIRQMDAYGFMQSTGPLTRAVDAQRMWAPAPPDPALPRSAWPEEERRLFQTGLGHFRDGRRERAESFFEALLEVNPDNPEARSMLELLRGPSPVRSAEDLDDLERPEPTSSRPHLAAGREPRRWVFRAALVVMLLVSAAAAGGFYVEAPFSVAEPAKVLGGQRYVVMSPVAGVVAEVLVTPGDRLEPEQPVLRIAPPGALERLSSVTAALAEAEEATTALEGEPPPEAKALAKRRGAVLKKLEGLEKKRAKLEKDAKKRGAKGKKAAKKLAKLEDDIGELKGKLARLDEEEAEVLRASPLGAQRATVELLRSDLAEAQAEAKGTLVAAEQGGAVEEPPALPERGAVVASGQPLVALGGAGRTIEVQVAETTLALVQPGGTFSFRAVAYPDTDFVARIVSVADRVTEVEGRSVVRVVGLPERGDVLLKPDMTGYAEFQGDAMPLTLVIVERVRRWARARFLL